MIVCNLPTKTISCPQGSNFLNLDTYVFMFEPSEDFDLPQGALTVRLMFERWDFLYCYSCLCQIVLWRSEKRSWKIELKTIRALIDNSSTSQLGQIRKFFVNNCCSVLTRQLRESWLNAEWNFILIIKLIGVSQPFQIYYISDSCYKLLDLSL